MNTSTNYPRSKSKCQVVLNGETVWYDWIPDERFVAENAQKLPFFGLEAIKRGEAAIKALVIYKNNPVPIGLRSDRYSSANVVESLKKLYKSIKQHVSEGRVKEVRLYDNRGLLPGSTLIMEWNNQYGYKLNLLPLYSGEFDLNKMTRR